ncbi:biotin/lipoyl-containing protein [Brumimicrobium mesophilum]|uniref:biotin/lipoyl-containing protein n=1 Tax=Brumimicrobium mesophilum TaxID=392717 RepID=UPI000D144535|nr:biotin/lipoyl-containing protein [Brumimicrobium mesophilum]
MFNGQTRSTDTKDNAIAVEKVVHQKVDKNNPNEVGAPLHGSLSSILVKEGDKVSKNQGLFVIEVMKMGTTICVNVDGKIKKIYIKEGTVVYNDDLIVEMQTVPTATLF